MFNTPQNLFKELEAKYQAFDNNLQHKLNLILKELQNMSTQMDALQAQVQANDDALASAVVLINDIAGLITAAGTDPAKLAALTTDLKSHDDSLAAAILANTPVVVEGTAWVATTIYAKGDTVLGSDGQTYSSSVKDNLGNDPILVNSTFWALVPVTVVPAAVKS